MIVTQREEGESYEKLAESLGLAAGTVRVRAHRARVQLKECYEANGGERQ